MNESRGQATATGFPTAFSSATYDVANELANWAGSTISYDANGNMVGDSVHTYNWNARNQLSMIDSGGTASFAYDPLGRRTNRTVLGVATGFLYNGANATQELAGNTLSANTLNGGIDEFFQRADGNPSNWTGQVGIFSPQVGLGATWGIYLGHDMNGRGCGCDKHEHALSPKPSPSVVRASLWDCCACLASEIARH